MKGGSSVLKRATLREVAQKAGTSMMTVSRVINSRDSVSDETRERVLRAIKELGYEPHKDARILRGGKAGRIGIVVSDIRNPFYSQVVGDLEDLAEENNMAVIVSDTSKRLDQEKKAIKSLLDIKVDAIVVAPEGYESAHLIDVISSGTEVVSFGVHFENEEISEVSIDEISGASKAGAYLRSAGISDAVMIMGNPRKFTTRGRMKGFRKGFGEVPEDKILYCEVDWKASCRRVMELHKLPEAFFCYNDMMALGVMKALEERGVKLGSEVRVIGYDDVYMAEIAGITTLRIPIRSMVEEAFKTILGEDVRKIVFTPEFIQRKSA
ncbi:MAG: Transcriptional regulator [Mesotoga infera]|uniref:Transcriptional regulator n=1 Tax=Mesotoga infera TaxID=1236046 RepID=A0A117M8E7_9BACT|nr:MAG: Transcriptional regulator [Mesotoga infera]KUK90084.1 MAG: Transcriptional regulator [Mesotoga infera]